jgi:hypothetical protein
MFEKNGGRGRFDGSSYPSLKTKVVHVFLCQDVEGLVVKITPQK